MRGAHDSLVAGFDLLLGTIDEAWAGVGLWVTAVLFGLALLLLLRFVSDAKAIRAARDRAEAELLAVRLYREEPRVVLHALLRFPAALGRYLRLWLLPIAVLSPPSIILMAQLDARYAHRALRPGESAVVEVFGEPSVIETATLAAGPGLTIGSGPVRNGHRGEASWQVRADHPGRHRLHLLAGGRTIEKRVVVSSDEKPAIADRARASGQSLLTAPAEPAIDPTSAVRHIRLRLPPLEFGVLGWRTSWIVVFLCTSAGVVLALRRRMGVEI